MSSYLVLFKCGKCGEEQPHTVTYVGNVVASIVCMHCGETVGPSAASLLREYLRDWETRLSRKPRKMMNHALRHPLAFFLYYLPRGVICKPGEIVHEWETIARAVGHRSEHR
jgi:hypothetical protein